MTSSAEAARKLYTYVDNGFYIDLISPGGSTQVHAAFSFILDDNLQVGQTSDYSTLTCLAGKQLCSSVTVTNFGNAVQARYNDESGGGTYLFVGEGTFLGSYQARSAVTLADTDVVYSYADTSGVALTFVSNGYLNLDSPSQITVAPRSCSTGDYICTSALVNGAPLSTFQVTETYSSTPETVTSVAIPRNFLRSGGSYSLREQGVSAQVAVVGPLAVVTPSVPEPATWAMMMLGMGAVGGALRCRQSKGTTKVSFA